MARRPSGGAGAGRYLFRDARIVDPASGRDERGHLLVEGERIADLAFSDPGPPGADIEVIDCAGHVLAPGLIDMRVFAGEPGFEHRETLGGASRSAAVGGVTSIVCRPDTAPVIDDVALVDYVTRRARDHAAVHVYPMAALTKGLSGTEMTEIGLLTEAGAVALSDAVTAVPDARIMRNALTYARAFDALICEHAEDAALANGGVMHEGEVSGRLGLPGIPAAAEIIVVERDLRLLELTGGRLHLSTLSCGASLEAVRRARAKGLSVSCGVSINNVVLNDNDVGPYRTFFKLRPPLRPEDDRAALVEGLARGEIDLIVSDHDPQDADSKRRPFIDAGFGAVGLETLLPAALRLYHGGHVGLPALLATMTVNPARLLRLDSGRLERGRPADLVLIDLDQPFVLEAEDLISKCQNTVFERQPLRGRAVATMVAGDIVHRAVRPKADA